MPEYLAPGVYVEEVETGAKAIEAVGTSTAGFLGETERGPVEPTFLTSFADFNRHFGGFAKYRRGEHLEGTNLAYAVKGFFDNGGGRCYVGRVTSATESADIGLGRYSPPMALLPDPDAVEFGSVVTDRAVTETVEIRHAGIDNDPGIEVAAVGVAGTEGGDTPGEFDARLPGGETTPFELAPGEPLLLEVVYQPTTDTEHQASLTVDHDGDGAPLEVRLHGEGMTPGDAVELVPSPSAVDYGTVAVDTGLTDSVTVRNDGLEGGADVTVTDVQLVPDGGDVGPFTITNKAEDFGSDVVLEVDERATIDVEVDHDTAEAVSAGLEVSFEIDGTPGDTTLDIRGDVVDPANTLGADAKLLDFGEVVTGTETDETVVLRNMGGSSDDPLTIDAVSLSDTTTGFSASLTAASPGTELAPGESTPLGIEFSPDAATTPTETVTVDYSDSGGSSTRTVEVTGTGIDVDAEFTAEPPAEDGLAFGEVVVGESETRTVVVSNTARPGGEPIVVNGIDLSNDDDDEYALPEDLVPESAPPVETLAPGETIEVPVTVTPASTGLADADLVIDHDAGGPATYALSATGVEPMVGFEAVGPGAWGGRVAVTVRNGARTNENFDLTVRYWTDRQDDPAVEEVFSDLTTEQSSSNYYETVIDSGSNLVEVERLGPDRPANGTTFLSVPSDPDAAEEVGLDEYTGSEAAPRGERTGLAGFAEIDDLSIVCVPDETSIDGLTEKIISHCEDPNLQDRIAVLQAPQGAEPGDLPPGTARSEYAAIYYPNIEIIDPETGLRKLVPPGGHVAGIYARSDRENGVWKAPANETVRGAVDLEFPISKADQTRLNPKGVNAIRSFPGRGIRVWGARTTSANPEWKYVNVRRLFLMVEESIDEGTQWVVFESNTEQLWARVRQSVRNFLETVWRDGGLAGSTPEEAFFVKADRTTMTQADIDNGRLIVEIGIAPVKPAEFVIFRITQWTEGVEGGS